MLQEFLIKILGDDITFGLILLSWLAIFILIMLLAMLFVKNKFDI